MRMTNDMREQVISVVLADELKKRDSIFYDFKKSVYEQVRKQYKDKKQKEMDGLGDYYFTSIHRISVRRSGRYILELTPSELIDIKKELGNILLPSERSGTKNVDINGNQKAEDLFNKYSVQKEKYTGLIIDLRGNLKSITTVKKLIGAFPEIEGKVYFAKKENTSISPNFDKFRSLMKTKKEI